MKKVFKLKTAAIFPLSRPVEAEINVPGSKSYSIRALMISALCKNNFKIHNLLESEDTKAMQNCIEALQAKRIDIEAEESGLTARFMTALACITPGTQIISGKPSLQKRPVKDLVNALRGLGANIEYMDKDGFLPLKVISSELTGNSITIFGGVSSQYVSALLLIAPLLKNGLTINIKGNLVSKPYIDMTIEAMDHFGVKVNNVFNYAHLTVESSNYKPNDFIVESDYSSAGYFFAIAALTKSKIAVDNLSYVSKQADRKFLATVGEIGAKIDTVRSSITAEGKSLRSGVFHVEDFPDQAMTLAVLCAFAEGKSVIKGIKSLRVKETERVKALENELAKMGIETSSTNDSLTIYGGKPHGATIDTYGDHRIAMAFAVAGTKLSGVEIMNPGVVGKTFPGFWEELGKITKVAFKEKEYSNILLIGMRGSGKTTVGKILAEKLGKKFIDMDVYIQEKHGRTVRDMVLENGWEYFRKLESEACTRLSQEKNVVISSGGGIVLDQTNMELFEENSVKVLLRAEPAVLSARIRSDASRPELTTQPTLLGELDEVWQKRKNKYYKNADFIIDTSKDSPDVISGEILTKLDLQELKLCLVIGDPVEHSLSPEIHNLGYELLGIEDEFKYDVKRVRTDEIADFISQVKSQNIRGVSVTIPHKEPILPYLDEVDPVARKIGAVNTIVNENGKLVGYNTDWLGVIKPLKKLVNLKGKSVAVFGAGGTARAFVYGLVEAGCDVTIYNRTVEKAKEIADKFGCKYADLKDAKAINKADIICNTTSVGMSEDKSPLDASLIKPSMIVFDAVYSPLETKLLKEARSKGAKTISGLEMLLEQAFAQFKLFTGKEALEDEIRKRLMEKLK